MPRNRIQMDFTDAGYAKLVEIGRRAGIPEDAPKTDIIRNALKLYGWYINQVKDGGWTLCLKKDSDMKEVELLFDE